MERGSVALVGAGPGDPGLITVRGLRLLQEADVVVYDRLVHPDLLDEAPSDAERIYIGKAYGRHILDQEELNNLLVYLAASGKRVVRLKGGDPFVFGRGSEEAEVLAARGVPFEIVPGISSAIAGPAYAGVPITDRRYTSSAVFVTGHKHPSDPDSTVDWRGLARSAGTIVLFMSMRHLDAIAAELVAGGRSGETPVAVIERATTREQRTVETTLGRLAVDVVGAGLRSPSIVVIGDVVRLRSKLAWFEERLDALAH